MIAKNPAGLFLLVAFPIFLVLVLTVESEHWGGTQTITVIVPGEPARGGIDPYNLLDWEEGDNIETIEINEAP